MRSKAELRLCLGACPGALSADCDKWLAAVDRDIARLNVTAAADDGAALATVRLRVDGVEREPGSSIELDPGPHTITVDSPGRQTVRRRIELAAGARERIALRLAASVGRPSDRALPMGPIVLGSIAGAAVAAAGALAIAGHVDVSSMRHPDGGCAPRCPESRVDRVRNMWIAGGVVGGAGVSAGVAALVWWAASDREDADEGAAIRPRLDATAGGFFFAIEATF